MLLVCLWSRVELNNLRGYLVGRIAQFLINLHPEEHDIWLTRHGESEYNREGKIGGDSGLTEDGEQYAKRLADFAERKVCRDANGNRRRARLWTSSLRRTKESAKHIQHYWVGDWVQMEPRHLRQLDEIYAGVCDGMTQARAVWLFSEAAIQGVEVE